MHGVITREPFCPDDQDFYPMRCGILAAEIEFKSLRLRCKSAGQRLFLLLDMT